MGVIPLRDKRLFVHRCAVRRSSLVFLCPIFPVIWPHPGFKLCPLSCFFVGYFVSSVESRGDT